MTTPTHGADVEHLRATAAQMTDAAEHLIAVDLRLTAALASLVWNGPDAMRARQAWDTEHGAALRATCRALVEAGRHLLTEAEQQQAASSATAGGDGPGTAAGEGGGSPAPSLSQRLQVLSTLLTSPQVRAALVRGAIAQVPEPVREAVGLANTALNINTLTGAVGVPVAVSAPVTGLGVANDVDNLHTAVQERDLDGAIRATGSLAATAAGRISPAHGAVAGLAWDGVYRFRDQVFTGSRMEENFVARNEAIADMVGPLAVPIGLGTFIVAGVETGWEKLTEVVTSEDSEDGQGGVGGR